MRTLSLALLTLALAWPARAEVTRVDVARRMDLGASGYEKITGTIHFAVDPKDPRNRAVVDLDKAPVNGAGRVEFSSDLYILRPKAPRGNGAALIDVLNRGNKVVLNGFNRGGLARSRDRKRSRRSLPDALRLHHRLGRLGVRSRRSPDDDEDSRAGGRPSAAPITGIVRATFTASAKATDVTVAELAKYDASDPGRHQTAA